MFGVSACELEWACCTLAASVGVHVVVACVCERVRVFAARMMVCRGVSGYALYVGAVTRHIEVVGVLTMVCSDCGR